MHPDDVMLTLVIVPCARRKIWDHNPAAGPTRASDAYTSAVFRLNKQYAQTFGDAWLILSAKYGLITPDFIIPAPYDVTLNRPSADTVAIEQIQAQAQRLGLDRYSTIIGLGGKAYRRILAAAIPHRPDGIPRFRFPFAGLPIGKAMQAVKQSLLEERQTHGLPKENY